ncbi:N-glycosidase [Lachnellula willkommii]|uniref:N-glycosidase n=1 Tax=Lachnellula willkommii TaxID=215461 RepID=A0A559ML61_9HELO|nr:N-glycosidase [Lachnellula willkommii]
MAHLEPPNHHGQQGQDLGSAAPTDASALVPVASPVRQSLVNNSHSEVVEPNTSESDHSKAPLAATQQEPRPSPSPIDRSEQASGTEGTNIPLGYKDPLADFPLRTPQMANKHGRAPAGSICFSSGTFSNFLQKSFKDADGNEWKSGEQYFQMGKCILFNDEDSIQKMLKADTPKKAKEVGNNVKGFEQKTWDIVKRQYMADALYFKFRGEPVMVKELLATGESLIIEARDDVVWGSGHNKADTMKKKISDWRGLNLLGEELMLLRDNFQPMEDESTKLPDGAQLPQEGEIRESGELADGPMIFRDKCWHVRDFDISKWEVIANDGECAEDVRLSGALALWISIDVQHGFGRGDEGEGEEPTPRSVFKAIEKQWKQLNAKKKKVPAVFGQDEIALALSDLSNKATKWRLVVVSRDRRDPEVFEAIRRGPGSDQEGENVFVRYFPKTRHGPERWEGMKLKSTLQQEDDVIDPTGGFDWDLDVDCSYDGKGGEDD